MITTVVHAVLSLSDEYVDIRYSKFSNERSVGELVYSNIHVIHAILSYVSSRTV